MGFDDKINDIYEMLCEKVHKDSTINLKNFKALILLANLCKLLNFGQYDYDLEEYNELFEKIMINFN